MCLVAVVPSLYLACGHTLCSAKAPEPIHTLCEPLPPPTAKLSSANASWSSENSHVCHAHHILVEVISHLASSRGTFLSWQLATLLLINVL